MFLTFTKRVMSFLDRRPNRRELEMIRSWWHESHDCCPEAVAMDINFVYPENLESINYENYKAGIPDGARDYCKVQELPMRILF